MTRETLITGLVAVGALSIAAAGHQPPAQPPLPAAALAATQIEKVKDNLYMITGADPTNRDAFSGGNTGVFITDAGVVVVDTKLAGWGQVLLDKIKTVTDKPVIRIINTHTHGDHTGSNSMFPATVDIVAHENTKANMAKMDAFKGDKAQFLPKRTYKDKLSLGSGKDRIDLYYFGAGHTSGDTFVVFPALRILHTGDMFALKDGPRCDRNNGGSCVSFPQTLSKVMANIKNVDTVIPGHSPMQTPKDLQDYQKFTADLLAYAVDQMKAGKSADDATAGFNVDKYSGYKKERVRGAIQAVYDELKK